ncbi:MAG: AraC family transcriptional regulator [Paenibacillus sp.]|nr:AraC family transcriptional regulator [Paenibacillus sp.]
MQVLELFIPPMPSLLTVGHSLWRPGGQHFRRSFEVFDMLIVVKGNLYMTEEGRPYEVGPGELLLLEPGLQHWGHESCKEQTEVYWVHFKHNLSYRSIDSHSIRWSAILPQGTDQDITPTEQHLYLPKYANIDLIRIRPLLDEMVALHRTLCKENASYLQAKLAELLVGLQVGLKREKISRSMSICEELKRALQLSYTEPFDAQALERTLHYNFDYAARCLKRHTGMSPLKYQHYLRIEEAKRLLSHSVLTVGEIGTRVGYSDDNYFIRMFRARIGVSPGVYRQSQWQQQMQDGL